MNILELTEGYYLANALQALENVGVLDSLKLPVTISVLAKRHRVDPDILEAALRMLVSRTDLVAQRAGKFCCTSQYDSKARFMLHQYLGAYGQNIVRLDAILRRPSRAGALIDRERHARAFAQIEVTGANIVADMISQLELNHVLDLGCGVGTLVVNLAMRDPGFIGWGLDANPWMCKEAKKRVASARVSKRVKLFEGDCRRVEAAVPSRVRDSVQTLCAAQVMNEFFKDSTKLAVAWLASVKKLFPGRVMIVADYCGPRRATRSPRSREVALHDFVQAISGQGVPPPNLAGWKKIYRAARCELVHVLELENSPFFIHVLRL